MGAVNRTSRSRCATDTTGRSGGSRAHAARWLAATVSVRERGLCAGHVENPTRNIRVLRVKGHWVLLVCGRLVVDRAPILVLAAEARRRELGPSALMADVIDRWCKVILEGGWPQNSLAPCGYPGRERPLYQRGLPDAHWQRQHGKELTPFRRIGPSDETAAFSRLRLIPELSRRLRRTERRAASQSLSRSGRCSSRGCPKGPAPKD
jgi:hypothetical protein